MLQPEQTQIKSLGPCTIDSPLPALLCNNLRKPLYVRDEKRLLFDDRVDGGSASFEMAGPREKIFFDPRQCKAGIVTCGGLCPGLNDVIRAIVLALWHNYGVHEIIGFRDGYRGCVEANGLVPLLLTPEVVDGWQDLGGTQLGSSRGDQDKAAIVDNLERLGINMLFCIGGDGTMRGAQGIADEIARRDARIVVVGSPKTIDNDIMYIDESFGFQSAYEAARQPIQCAHVEAKGAPHGVGLVKIMGRHSGFLACAAALSTSDVNFVLIPELPEFELGQFLQALEKRLDVSDHAVVVVAEGFGQHLLKGETGVDASGNKKLKDIGLFLKESIVDHFKCAGKEAGVKYIDPSYIIRSVKANAADSIYCLQIGHDAVHAAMAGKTEMMVGRWHGRLVHIPIHLATSGRKQVVLQEELWQTVLETTGMLKWMEI